MIGSLQGTDDWARTRDSHAELSPVDIQFREFARLDPECLRRSSFRDPERESRLQFPRQPWPLFVSPALVNDLAEAALTVSRLVRSIPERIFHGDRERMAVSFGMKRAALELVLRPPDGIAEALSRGDFILTSAGFKCTELNVGGNLGGADNCVVAEMTMQMPAIRRFIAALGRRVTHRDSFRLIARYVIGRVLGSGLSDREVNAALVMASYDPAREPLLDLLKREYEAVLHELGPALHGRLLICRYEDLTAQDNVLFCSGARLHALVQGDLSSTTAAVFRCFKAGSLHLYDGPLSMPMSDKLNFALLSESADSDALNAEERAAVEKYVPWTRRLAPGRVTRHGEREDLLRLVMAQRQDLVLKRALSLGGADVILGRESSPEAWDQAVRRALSRGRWLVQEYLTSRPYLFQHGEEGCSAHTAIWGPFLLGSEFGGTFMRVLPESTGGVVNIARGGSSTVLLEVEEPLAGGDQPGTERRS